MRKLNMELFSVENESQAAALREIADYLDKNPDVMVMNLQSDFIWDGPGSDSYFEITFSSC